MEIEIDLMEATLHAVSYLKCPHTGKRFSPEEIIQTLADDLGLSDTRPGSWEGRICNR